MKRKWLVYVVCLGHALFMLLLSWWWLSLNYNLELEDNLVRWTSLVKRILPFTSTHDPGRLSAYTFVDISGARMLADQPAGLGKDAITDRRQLDSLLQIISRATPGPDAVICDVFFDRATDQDLQLQKSINRIPGIVFPYSFGGDSVVLPAVPGIPSAYSAYYSSSGVGLKDSFLKFHLIEGDTMKSIPLRTYEWISHKQLRKRAGLLWGGGRPMSNTVIPDIKILPVELSDEQFSRIIPLEDLLVLNNDEAAGKFFSNKIVVIGDFQTEMHTSIYDQIPGALIIVNVLESLIAGEVNFSYLMLFYLLACYGVLSYLVLYYEGGPGSLEERITRISYPLVGSVGSRMLGFSLGLYIVSIICYFVFNVHTDILPMATYLSMVSLIRRKGQAPLRKIVRKRRKVVGEAVNQ
ncbi:CHASE2 domain-containing protein [Chryseolinea sp. T2]|uniref:CHASE2 domain-containing protein n=1 Tax=Chryseolinea sp. T2 TaxID=3129255 RepID=UPI003078726E